MQHTREQRKAELFVLEGIHLTRSCLESGGEVIAIYIDIAAQDNPEVLALLKAAPKLEVTWLTAGLLSTLSELSSAPELISLARRRALKPLSFECSSLLLEKIQDPGNMGTILRSAAASGIQQLCLSDNCTDPYAAKVLRAGMGAHFVVSIHEKIDLSAYLSAFKGKKIVTALHENTQSLYSCDLKGTVAFVFGNEGEGVSKELIDLADSVVKIPMPGCAESLNVAMAVSVCLFERVRQFEKADNQC